MAAELPTKSLSGGRYELIEVLGVGGTASVYRAHDEILKVDRAIKVLTPELAEQGSLQERFLLEARTTASLSHPHVVTVHDYGQDGEHSFMVMEWLEGGSLLDHLEQTGRFSALQAIDLLLPILQGLAAVHAMGVIHRDIKPANILLSTGGVPKLSDFGIAHASHEDRSLTRTGTVLGTWLFMAPEQRTDGRTVDERSDIYAMGATLYMLVTGLAPLDLYATNLQAKLFAGIPAPLSEVIKGAAAYEPEDRYPTAAAMYEALLEARASLGAGDLSPAMLEAHPPAVVSAPTAVPLGTAAYAATAVPPATAVHPGAAPPARRQRYGAWVALAALLIGTTVFAASRLSGDTSSGLHPVAKLQASQPPPGPPESATAANVPAPEAQTEREATPVTAGTAQLDVPEAAPPQNVHRPTRAEASADAAVEPMAQAELESDAALAVEDEPDLTELTASEPDLAVAMSQEAVFDDETWAHYDEAMGEVIAASDDLDEGSGLRTRISIRGLKGHARVFRMANDDDFAWTGCKVTLNDDYHYDIKPVAANQSSNVVIMRFRNFFGDCFPPDSAVDRVSLSCDQGDTTLSLE